MLSERADPFRQPVVLSCQPGESLADFFSSLFCLFCINADSMAKNISVTTGAASPPIVVQDIEKENLKCLKNLWKNAKNSLAIARR